MKNNYVFSIEEDIRAVVYNPWNETISQVCMALNRLCRHYNKTIQSKEIAIELEKMNKALLDLHTLTIYENALANLVSNRLSCTYNNKLELNDKNVEIAITRNIDNQSIDLLVKALENNKRLIDSFEMNLFMLRKFVFDCAATNNDYQPMPEKINIKSIKF